jgi:hypothetical protein
MKLKCKGEISTMKDYIKKIITDDAKYEMRGRGLQGLGNPSDKDGAYIYGGVTLSYAF